MKNLVDKVEVFLAYSDEKLIELREKNQALKLLISEDRKG